MPAIPTGVKIAIGIFTTNSDKSVVYQDPASYALALVSETPADTLTLEEAPAPAAGSFDDGNGNTHSFAAGDNVWLLSAVNEGEDVEISASGLPYVMPNLSLTTATVVTPESGSFAVSPFAPGV